VFDPLHPDHLRDPYPNYHALRAADPVHRSELFQAFVLSRHADVWNVLRDPRFSVDRSQVDPVKSSPLPALGAEFVELGGALRRVLMFLDPPDHTRMRRLVARAFARVGLRNRRRRIQQLVDELLDAAAERGAIDFVEAFAYPLPVIAIAEILGVPVSERSAIKRWSDDLGALLDPFVAEAVFRRALDSARDMHLFFREAIAERRAESRSDLLGALLAAEDESGKLSEAELFASCALLLAAGHLTTTNLLGNALWALWCNPEERRRLTTHAWLLPTAVEEFLRYDGPLQATGRLSTEPVVIGGVEIPAGAYVVALLGAANRDPAEFPEPDRLDVGRVDNRHVSFGQGIHHCLGAELARLNAQVALGTLLRRFPDWAVACDAPPRKPNVVSRGFASLPLVLGPPRG
jgi:cytochrome P450